MTHRASGFPIFLVGVLAYFLSEQRERQVVFKYLTTARGQTRLLVIGDLPTDVLAILDGLPQAASI